MPRAGRVFALHQIPDIEQIVSQRAAQCRPYVPEPALAHLAGAWAKITGTPLDDDAEDTQAWSALEAAAAIVRVDAESGEFDVERFVMVHDSGTPLNPKLIEGQVRGGLAQGLGQALGEELVYDPETGQLLNGTMMDYFAPTACDLPPIELMHTAIASPVTPMGVRNAGEVGTIPAAAAIANAICDALSDFGVEINRLPITPELVWKTLRERTPAST